MQTEGTLFQTVATRPVLTPVSPASSLVLSTQQVDLLGGGDIMEKQGLTIAGTTAAELEDAKTAALNGTDSRVGAVELSVASQPTLAPLTNTQPATPPPATTTQTQAQNAQGAELNKQCSGGFPNCSLCSGFNFGGLDQKLADLLGLKAIRDFLNDLLKAKNWGLLSNILKCIRYIAGTSVGQLTQVIAVTIRSGGGLQGLAHATKVIDINNLPAHDLIRHGLQYTDGSSDAHATLASLARDSGGDLSDYVYRTPLTGSEMRAMDATRVSEMYGGNAYAPGTAALVGTDNAKMATAIASTFG
jgi:hypothetical protein